MKTEWVVLADAARARIFARLGNGGWQDIRDLTRGGGDTTNGREVRLPAAMRKLKDLVAGNGGGRDDFIARLGSDLRAARKRGDFDALVLVAPPDVLEKLESSLDPATRRKLVGKATDNLVGLPLKDARREIARRF